MRKGSLTFKHRKTKRFNAVALVKKIKEGNRIISCDPILKKTAVSTTIKNKSINKHLTFGVKNTFPANAMQRCILLT